MAILVISLTVLPEKQNELLQALHALFIETRCMQGCRSAQVLMNTEEKHHLVLYGEWIIEEDLNRYLTSENAQVLFGAVSTLSESYKVNLGSTNVYQIHSSSKSCGLSCPA